jgi:hypothetical protein
MKRPKRRGGGRRHRARPTPKWLLSSEEIDQVAKARCLMLLSVLSGEKPVTDAVTDTGISRGMYYQLETRALEAMLRALGPAAVETPREESGALRRIAELEVKLQKAEAAKRRAERLLLMTRRLVKGGVTLRGRTSSTRSGKSPSRGSSRTQPEGPEKTSTPAVSGELRR